MAAGCQRSLEAVDTRDFPPDVIFGVDTAQVTVQVTPGDTETMRNVSVIARVATGRDMQIQRSHRFTVELN